MRTYFAFAALIVFFACSPVFVGEAFAQAKPQRPTPQEGKKNQRPTPKTEEELQKEAEERKRKEMEKSAVEEPGVIPVETNLVSVDAVVLNKKTGQIISGLKKENFVIYEDGVKKDI